MAKDPQLPPPSGSREGHQAVGISRERELLGAREPLHRVLDAERETAISAAPREEQLERTAAPGVARPLASIMRGDAGGHVGGDAAVEGAVRAPREVDVPGQSVVSLTQHIRVGGA